MQTFPFVFFHNVLPDKPPAFRTAGEIPPGQDAKKMKDRGMKRLYSETETVFLSVVGKQMCAVGELHKGLLGGVPRFWRSL